MGWFKTKRAKPLVLHIDDSEDILLMTRVNLRALGCEVLTAADAATGFEIAQREQPDLILMDAQMPDIDGYKATQALKGNPTTRDIPILMATGEDQVKLVDKALGYGADNYITKPLEINRLRLKLSEMIRLPEKPA